MKKQKVKELVKAYAPGLPPSKFRLLRSERNLNSLISDYLSSYTRRPSLRKQSTSKLPERSESSEECFNTLYYYQEDYVQAEIFCSQEIAYEIINRNLHQSIAENCSLKSLVYTGDSFLLQGTSDQVQDAVNELHGKMKDFEPTDQVSKNSGTARDLKNKKFHNKMKFVGDAECIFCAFEIQIGERVRRTPCLHLFHHQCLELWVQEHRNCPIDKMPLK